MTDKILDKEWRRFAEMGIPRDATIRERIQMRNAFYIGAQVAYTAIFSSLIVAEEGDVKTESINPEIVEMLKTEIQDFLRGHQEASAKVPL